MCSCSQVSIPYLGKQKQQIEMPADWRELSDQDHLAHLSSFEKMYLGTEGVEQMPLKSQEQEYVNNLIYDIYHNNELFFKASSSPRIHVIRNDIPFHFSLPGSSIFLSTGLINKYIKHEGILAAIICYEMIRIDKNIYNKNVIVPIGFMTLDRILGLNRIVTDKKIEVHKWAYYLMRRAGYEGEYYLQWLQTINRNTADFLTLIGDAASISREEAMFKAFVIRRSKVEDERTIARKESSKNFYAFLFSVKDRNI
jgi:hypothetical protein